MHRSSCFLFLLSTWFCTCDRKTNHVLLPSSFFASTYPAVMLHPVAALRLPHGKLQSHRQERAKFDVIHVCFQQRDPGPVSSERHPFAPSVVRRWVLHGERGSTRQNDFGRDERSPRPGRISLMQRTPGRHRHFQSPEAGIYWSEKIHRMMSKALKVEQFERQIFRSPVSISIGAAYRLIFRCIQDTSNTLFEECRLYNYLSILLICVGADLIGAETTAVMTLDISACVSHSCQDTCDSVVVAPTGFWHEHFL